MSNLEFFISDCISEINERYENSRKKSSDDPKNMFWSGHSCDYQEVFEIIQNRAKIYDIKLDDEENK